MNIVKKIFYFTYRINIKRNDKNLSLFTGFGMIIVVFVFNHLAPIVRILSHSFPSPFWDKTDKWVEGFVLISVLIAMYISYFHEDTLKMTDVVKDYSPWKQPLVGGFIYIVVSFIVAVVILFLT